MKRFSLIILSILLASIPSSVSATHYKVNVSDRLNVRESPSKSALVISVLFDGDVVTSTSETLELQNNDGVEWAKIQLSDGRKGYVAASYLEEVNTIEEKKPSFSIDGGLVLTFCMFVLSLLAIINAWLESHTHNHSSSWLRIFFWLLLGVSIIYMVLFVDEFEEILSIRYWHCKGWEIKRYLLSFIATITLAGVTLQIYNSFVKIVCGMVYKKHGSLHMMKNVHLGAFYWLNAVSLLLILLLPVLSIVALICFLWFGIRLFKLLRPNYLLVCKIIILGVIVMGLNMSLSIMCTRSAPVLALIYTIVSYLLYFIDGFELSLYELYEEDYDRGYNLKSRVGDTSSLLQSRSGNLNEFTKENSPSEIENKRVDTDDEKNDREERVAYENYERYKKEAEEAYRNYEYYHSKAQSAIDNAEINYRDAEDHERMAHEYDDEIHLNDARRAKAMAEHFERKASEFADEAEEWYKKYTNSKAEVDYYYNEYEHSKRS